MTNKTATIAAVVVTFNRKLLLIECLNALLAQTRPMDKIYLIDNASSDGTQALLEEHNLLNHPLIDYRLMTENLGGAGGFYEGIKAAHEDGYDWIWVMDDDAEACIDAAEKLEPYFNKPGVIAVCPILKDADNNIEIKNHRGWFIPFSQKGGLVKPVLQNDLKKVDALIINQCSFVGLCFASKAINAIGLPKKDFFIHYDDTEFCNRLSRIGQIWLITKSCIRHKEAAKTDATVKQNNLGRETDRMAYDKLWINYYGYRNLIWLVLNKESTIAEVCRLYLMHIRKIIAVILYDDHKVTRIKFWNSAFLDGVRGIFDNQKPKKILK
jgi:GT2 family glycosyltransferase